MVTTKEECPCSDPHCCCNPWAHELRHECAPEAEPGQDGVCSCGTAFRWVEGFDDLEEGCPTIPIRRIMELHGIGGYWRAVETDR